MEFKQTMAICGVLAFLGTLTAVVTATAAIVALRIVGQERVSRWTGAASAWLFNGRGVARKIAVIPVIVLGGYVTVLLGASIASREQALPPGEEKYFCEIDCHLAYSVATVDTTKTLGSTSARETASGTFYVISVRTRFDEHTVSPHRGDAPLTPSPRIVTIEDDAGRSYSISQAGQQALENSLGVEWTPLTRPLRPGECYATQLVFDLPSNARGPKLLIAGPAEPEWLGRIIIGEEDSILHKKVYLRLPNG
jgi:hypothetical protein